MQHASLGCSLLAAIPLDHIPRVWLRETKKMIAIARKKERRHECEKREIPRREGERERERERESEKTHPSKNRKGAVSLLPYGHL